MKNNFSCDVNIFAIFHIFANILQAESGIIYTMMMIVMDAAKLNQLYSFILKINEETLI